MVLEVTNDNGATTRNITSEVSRSDITDPAERNKANGTLLTETYLEYEWTGTKR